jgi:hypothetical protein
VQSPNLPDDLQAVSGALNMACQPAMLAGGTYVDGTVRTFGCQSCHMRPDVGESCNKNIRPAPISPSTIRPAATTGCGR